MRRPARLVPVLLLSGALAVSGCSEDEEPAASAPAAESSDEAQAPDSGGARVEEVDLEDVLVEQTLVAVDQPDSSVTVGVLSLEVEDEVMRLELAVTPDRASVGDEERQSFYDLRGYFSDPSLFDRQNLKRYDVVRAGPGRRYESAPVETKTVNGRPMRVYFYFAAPQDDVDAVDVVLSDSYPAFEDVPIT